MRLSVLIYTPQGKAKSRRRGSQRKDRVRDSIIVFTSDHGEEFGEHGIFGVPSHTLFQELVSVSLIVHVPWTNPEGVSVPDQVQSIDISPTILEIATADTPVFSSGLAGDLSPDDRNINQNNRECRRT
jgi:arylsulfatase A-like enzyme